MNASPMRTAIGGGGGCPRRLRDTARWLTVGLLAAALVIGAGLPAVAKGPDHRSASTQRQEQPFAAEKKGKKGGKFKTVRKTFSDDGTIAVPAVASVDEIGPADPFPAAIQVSGFGKKAKISDINLTLRNVGHTFPPDVAVLLVAQNGRNALVMADVGDFENAEAVTDVTLTLDDEAAEALPESDLLTSGSFRPFDGGEPGPDGDPGGDFQAPAPALSGDVALSTFDGGNPNGLWTLFVLDDEFNDVGAIADGWELQITAKVKKKRRH